MLAWTLFCQLVSTQGSSPSCEEKVLDPLEVVFVIDGSGSVTPQAFRSQLRLANAMLDSVRDMYANTTVDWYWSSLLFSVDTLVLKDMHSNSGSQDRFDESHWRMCPGSSLPPARPFRLCGTYYKPALEQANSMFVADSGRKRAIWFLTDGKPNDIQSPEELKEFRQQLFPSGEALLASVYLTPQSGTIEDGKELLQAFSCPDTNPLCEDRILVGDTSTDMAEFATRAQNIFRSQLENTVTKPCLIPSTSPPPVTTTPPLTPPEDNFLTTVAILAAMAALGCCCLVLVGSKRNRRKGPDEETPMRQATAPTQHRPVRRHKANVPMDRPNSSTGTALTDVYNSRTPSSRPRYFPQR